MFQPEVRVYEPLVQEIERVYDDISQFLENPLVVTLLYKSFIHRQALPSKRKYFYEQIYVALFEEYDQTKGGGFIHEKHSNLDKDDFRTVLRALGFITSIKGNNWYSNDEIIHLLVKAQKLSKIDFKPDKFLKDLYSVVPLFVKEGLSYGWAHKSLQDYFASQYINVDSKELQKDYLLKILQKGSQYMNVLALYYEANKDTFKKVIVLHIINEFISFYETKYKGFESDLVSKEDIHLRKLLTFGKDVYITRITKPEGYYDPEFDSGGLIREPNEFAIGIIHENDKYTYYVRWKEDYLQNGTNLINYIKDPIFNSLFQKNNESFNLLYKDSLDKQDFMEDNVNYHANDQSCFLNKSEWFNITNHILMRTFSPKFKRDVAIPFSFQSYSISECIIFREKVNKEIQNDLENSFIDF